MDIMKLGATAVDPEGILRWISPNSRTPESPSGTRGQTVGTSSRAVCQNLPSSGKGVDMNLIQLGTIEELASSQDSTTFPTEHEDH